MSDKWADYLISAVRYENTETKERISELKVSADQGNEAGRSRVWQKGEVIRSIENGNKFLTVFENGDKWRKGEEVHVVKVKGNKFLRTDPNEIEEDNLGSLPEF